MLKFEQVINHVDCSRGAPMGRQSDSTIPTSRIHLRYVPFFDGDYDRGGAYWGSPANLFVAWGETEKEQWVYFLRAKSREEAKEMLLEKFPKIKFFR